MHPWVRSTWLRRWVSTSLQIGEVAETAATRVLTPGELLDDLRKNLARTKPLVSQELTPHLLTLSGDLVNRNRTEPPQVYGGFIYEKLKDPNDRSVTLTVLVPEGLYCQLPVRGGRCNLKGLIAQSYITKEFQLVLEVTEVLENEHLIEMASLEEIRLKVRASRALLHIPNLALLLQDLHHDRKRPRGLTITGKESIVDQDVLNALGPALNAYQLTFRRLSMQHKPDELIQEFESLKDSSAYDFVAVTRGGGDLWVFDEEELAQAAAKVNLPLLCAIGHAKNSVLFEDACDKAFDTPTLLGMFLNKVAQIDESHQAPSESQEGEMSKMKQLLCLDRTPFQVAVVLSLVGTSTIGLWS